MRFPHLLRRLTPLFLACLTLAQPGVQPAAAQDVIVDLGTSGPWSLRKTVSNGMTTMCDGIMLTGSEQGLRFAFTRDQSMIGFSDLGSAMQDGVQDVQIWFDGNRAEATGWYMALEYDAYGFPWRSYVSSNDEPDGMLDLFANASTIHFGYDVPGSGRYEAAFPLTGSNRVFYQVIDCLQSADAVPTPAPAPAPIPTPAPAPAPEPAPAAGAPYVIYGTCKLVVDGTIYIDIRNSCPIWMANDGTGAFWINTDRENYLGDYFAEIMPQGGGMASGNWNGEKGATHAQSFLGEDFRLASGGCWVNARAMICAAK